MPPNAVGDSPATNVGVGRNSQREALPELLSHVDTAADLDRKHPYRCGVSQTPHLDDACGARPGLPAERYGTLDGSVEERTREPPEPS